MTWFLVVILWLAAVVPAPPTQAVAIAIAGLFAIFSPPFLKAVPWTGAQMTALTMFLSLGIAVLASWLTGDLVWSREGVANALLNSSAVWTVQQIVYATLKQVAPATVGAEPKPAPTAPVGGTKSPTT